jgi:hypothetical protein
MAYELEQLGFVTRRFHEMICKGEKLSESMVHMRSGMFDALSRAVAMYNATLELTRLNLEAKQAAKDDESEQKRRQREKDDEERQQRHDDWLKEQREKDKQWHKERERVNRDHYKYNLTYCYRCNNPKPKGHLYCCECYYQYHRRHWD